MDVKKHELLACALLSDELSYTVLFYVCPRHYPLATVAILSYTHFLMLLLQTLRETLIIMNSRVETLLHYLPTIELEYIVQWRFQDL